tara:strand:- start:63 stop:620 length:558 start_codon:yes stop_codon:yes gene_type:complete
MKKLLFILALFILYSCEKEEDESTPPSGNSIVIGCQDECNAWQRCVNISQDFFGFEWACRPKLELYTNHGNWDGELNVIDESGNTHLYELENLNSITQGLQNIYFVFPEYGLTSHLILNFINSETLEFTINDMVYDPHVQSNVYYNGTGQLIHTGGSADTVLEFNCDFTYENKNYSVSFSAIRYS